MRRRTAEVFTYMFQTSKPNHDVPQITALEFVPLVKKGDRTAQLEQVFVITWKLSTEIKTCVFSRTLPQISKNTMKTRSKCWNYFRLTPPPLCAFNFRHAEALLSLRGEKSSSSRLLPETHSCPTLHLIWRRDTTISRLLCVGQSIFTGQHHTNKTPLDIYSRNTPYIFYLLLFLVWIIICLISVKHPNKVTSNKMFFDWRCTEGGGGIKVYMYCQRRDSRWHYLLNKTGKWW